MIFDLSLSDTNYIQAFGDFNFCLDMVWVSHFDDNSVTSCYMKKFGLRALSLMDPLKNFACEFPLLDFDILGSDLQYLIKT